MLTGTELCPRALCHTRPTTGSSFSGPLNAVAQIQCTHYSIALVRYYARQPQSAHGKIIIARPGPQNICNYKIITSRTNDSGNTPHMRRRGRRRRCRCWSRLPGNMFGSYNVCVHTQVHLKFANCMFKQMPREHTHTRDPFARKRGSTM